MNKIILASQSPRRRYLLSEMGVEFEVQPSNFEEYLDNDRDVEEVAKELSLGKALDVAKDHPDDYVIGSDTIVYIEGRQLAKTETIEDARQMLLDLAGKENLVVSGVALVNHSKNVELTDTETTRVQFKADSDEVTKLREEYLASGSWRDKAGSYGLQDGAAPLIESISGDYDNLMGLPTRKLAQMLNAQGIVAKHVVEAAPVAQLDKADPV
jgi:septum formation protein